MESSCIFAVGLNSRCRFLGPIHRVVPLYFLCCHKPSFQSVISGTLLLTYNKNVCACQQQSHCDLLLLSDNGGFVCLQNTLWALLVSRETIDQIEVQFF
ncbi:hypothetical protein GDO78_002265 [Eleutherodactylus coqui]|uniref:Uncharacterized protein n=1 Tax=Eleutherodactylus coqui TaxID=57060 RepID=A0A8J6K638_ELECQ|nr:hypothetical protein GDO78_002265 [Eleutherodactylus coqui]